MCVCVLVPFLVPELGDEFLIAFAQRRLLISTHQPTAVQEKLSQRWAGGKKRGKENDPVYSVLRNWTRSHNVNEPSFSL